MSRGLADLLRVPSFEELFRGRLLGLDGLRAVAIAGVLALHANELLPGGHLGVSVFFVLSGYIITNALLVERDPRGAVDLFAFYVRRFARLMPAFVVAMVAAGVLAIGRGLGWQSVLGAVGASLLYVTNLVRTFFGNDYLRGFGWTWTLALEEQFYLVWPVLLLFTIRRSWRWSLAVAIAGTIVPAVLRFFLPTLADPVPAQLYYGPHSRISGLMLGCAVALVLARRPARLSRPAANGLLFGALAVLGVAYVLAHAEDVTTYTAWLPLIEVASAAAIVAVIAAPDAAVARALSLRPVAFVGLISYGIYLWNATVLDNMEAVLALSVPSAVLWLGATLVVSAASYIWLETPIRDRARAYLKARREPAQPDVEPALDR